MRNKEGSSGEISEAKSGERKKANKVRKRRKVIYQVEEQNGENCFYPRVNRF